MVKEYLSTLIQTLHRERVFGLALAVVSLILLGSVGFVLTEPGEGTWLARFGQGAWWALVTLTTVGYGDVVPVTVAGRIVAAAIILGGVVSLSLITATVASVFIERKFRRERGLEPVKATQHILLLGWNREGDALLDQLVKRLPDDIPLVLINKQPPEQMEALQERYPAKPPIYLRGEYSREEVLLKANVRQAIKAIILAERQFPEETAAQVDQRTLFTALTLKAVNPKIRILAELLRPENRTHLERAGAEDVLVRGQYDSSLLARAIASPGLFRIFTNLLGGEGQNLWSLEVPGHFYGRPLAELAAHLRDHHQSLLIAIFTETRALSLEDLLGEEPSAINDFIRRKFAETKMTHLLGRTKVDYQVNPPGETVLGPHQFAVVIASKRPEM